MQNTTLIALERVTKGASFVPSDEGILIARSSVHLGATRCIQAENQLYYRSFNRSIESAGHAASVGKKMPYSNQLGLALWEDDREYPRPFPKL